MSAGKRTALAAVAVGVGLLACLLAFYPVDAVTVRLPRDDNRLFGAARTARGGDIRLRYRHSVEKTLVEGVFTVGPGPVLVAKETRMASVGTGLPNDRADRTRREGGWLVVDEGSRVVPGFDFFIVAINATRLMVNGTAIAVGQLPTGSVVHIEVERVRLWDWARWSLGRRAWRKDRQP
jgi:hypothetical protein